MIGISMDKAPEKGYLLAYFRDALVFEPYTVENGRLVFPGCELYQEAVPMECHLFDRNTEYRMILREARRDRVEVILTRQEEESMDPELLYEEYVLVRDEYAGKRGLPERLRIVNRYTYTEHDMIRLLLTPENTTPFRNIDNLIAMIYLRCGGRVIYLPGRAPEAA